MSWLIVGHIQCVTVHTSALPNIQNQSSLQLGSNAP